MDLSGLSKPQLVDQLITLAANLKEDDLKDPATYGMVVQLLNILDPAPEPLPQDMIEQLQTIADPKNRFLQAAMGLNATSLEQLGRLAESMKAAGLMKAEDLDELAKGALHWKEKAERKRKKQSVKKPISSLRETEHPHDPVLNGKAEQKVPSQEYQEKSRAYLESHGVKMPPRANEPVYPSDRKIKKSGDFMDAYEKLMKKIASFKERLEKSAELDKGVDQFGNGIKGRNKRYQQAKVFGKPSDVKTEVKADGKKVHSYKIPDANGPRVSPQRMKMMNAIKDYAEKKVGAKMVVAEGKRDETGKLKAKPPIEKQPFDVFSKEGHAAEKKRQGKIDAHNSSLKPGQKPKKRVDPKPDHRSGNLETQPSPDAAIHEIAHEALAPKHMTMEQHQTHMDKLWGESQSKYGHMQQKKTAGEIQPMAAENPIRREIGLPANRTAQKVKDATKPVENTVDGTGPRFNRGKDSKGRPVDLMRQSRLLSPENKHRIEALRDGRLKYSKDGITEGTSVDAKINARAAQAKTASAPKANEAVKPAAKPANHINKPEKLAASEIARDGKSFQQMKESPDSKE